MVMSYDYDASGSADAENWYVGDWGVGVMSGWAGYAAGVDD